MTDRADLWCSLGLAGTWLGVEWVGDWALCFQIHRQWSEFCLVNNIWVNERCTNREVEREIRN